MAQGFLLLFLYLSRKETLEEPMNLSQIIAAIESGKIVHWANTSYRVIKDRLGRYLIQCVNGHCIGLTWLDGVTLNGKEQDFFIAQDGN